MAVSPDPAHDKRVVGGGRVALLPHFGVLLYSLGQEGCDCVIVKLTCLVFLRGLDILTGVVFMGTNETPVCLLLCWQVLAIYVSKQDGE